MFCLLETNVSHFGFEGGSLLQQAATWSEVTFSGTAPTGREDHTAVWSEAADGMYIFGGRDGSGCCGIGSPVLGAAAGQKWRVPQPKDGRSCAEASSTTCISLTARPPERTEVGEASEQFLLGVPKTLGFKFSGNRRSIKHQLSSALPSWLICFVSISFSQLCWHCACEIL